MKKYSILIISILSISTARAQTGANSKVAFAGEKGVYIYNLFKPASTHYPDGTVIGFKLERQQSGQPNWKVIATAEAPATYPAFLRSMAYAQNVAYEPMPDATPLTIWTKFNKCHCYDSLTYYLAAQVYDIALNVIWVDTTARKGNAYTYRVSQVDKNNNTVKSYVTNEVRFPGVTAFNKPRFLHRESSAEHISIRWFAKGDIEAPKNVRVYRRRETQQAFEVIHPLLTFSKTRDTTFYYITDNDVAENEMYYYTIAPTTVFGGGFNVHSDTVAATNYDINKMLLPQLFTATGKDERNLIQLNWHVYKPAYVGTIQIYRSEKYDTGYKQIGTASNIDTGYDDHNVRSGIKYYYYLKITDKLKHHSQRSVKVFGLFYSHRLPRIPYHVRAVATDKVTQIKWACDDKDIDGYYVSRCKGIDGKMTIISPFIPYKDTAGQFTDTTRLDPLYTYGYAIQQENISHVLSVYSRIVYVQPHTQAALFAPKQLKAVRNNGTVTLLWEDMRLLNAGVKGYNVYRRETRNSDFIKLNKNMLASQYRTYNDTTVKTGKEYEYSVETVDISNYTSPKSASAFVTIPAMPLSTPAGLVGYASAGNVVLQWEPSVSGNISGYHVYRYQRGAKPVIAATIDKAPFTYTDATIKTNELYFYFITAYQTDGTESGPSNEISVRGL